MTVLKVGTTVKNFISAVNANFTELANKLTYKPISYKILFDGSAEIPSNSDGGTATITLNDSITNFDGIIIQREDTDAWQRIAPMTVGTVLKPLNTESDFGMMEGCNLYLCNVEITNATTLTLSNNVYSGVKTSAGARYLSGFSDKPLTRIIGIKLN